VEDVSIWLGRHLSTVAVHLGKPRRSATSALIKKLMGAAASVGPASTSSSIALKTSLAASNGKPMNPRTYARLAWEVLTARDRYRNYRRARRLSSNGAIVVCDRYPLPEIKRMDGAVTAHIADESRHGRLFKYLAELERGFYDRITYPDLLIVLRVDPDIAVQRRSGQQEESILRPRSEEIWETEWGRSRAVVIDAGKPKEQMLSEIRSVVWSRL
jgi:thymidylate kinase